MSKEFRVGTILLSGETVQNDGNNGLLVNGLNLTGTLQNAFYPLNSNPSSYITTGQTGSFGGGNAGGSGTNVQITGSATLTTSNFTGVSGINLFLSGDNQGVFVDGGAFALNVNTGQFITTAQTGNFGGGNFNTGTLTGTFALLNGNNIYLGNSYTLGNDIITGQEFIFISNLSGQSSSSQNISGIGLLLGNPSLAGYPTGVQISPSLNFSGNNYVTGVGFTGNVPMQWRIYSTGTTGIPTVGGITSQLNFETSTGFSNFATPLKIGYNPLTNIATLSSSPSLTITANIIATTSLETNTYTNLNGNSMLFTNGNILTVTAYPSYIFTSNPYSLTTITGAVNVNAIIFTGQYNSNGGAVNYNHFVVAPNYNFVGPQSGKIYDSRINSTSPNLSGAKHYLFDASNSGISHFCILTSGGSSGSNINYTGFIGINNPNPKYALDVSGIINTTYLNFPGSNIQNGTLNDSSNIEAVGWAARGLYDTTAVESVDWGNRALKNSSAVHTIDYQNLILTGGQWNAQNLLVQGTPVIAGNVGTSPTSGTTVLPITSDIYGTAGVLLAQPAGWISFIISGGLTGRLPYY